MSDGRCRWEHCIVEWIWKESSITIYLPNSQPVQRSGSYTEPAQALSMLGNDGWAVVTCVAEANWILWTLQRPAA